jgi:plasmid stabilization system protein ParE
VAKEVRKIIRSTFLEEDLVEIYQYGIETFGKIAADVFLEQILHSINGLSFRFLIHPECKHLETKSQMYRNIILGKYLVIYRIKSSRIEVLRAMHGSQSPSSFRKVRSIKP